jgi:phage terminase small subunit
MPITRAAETNLIVPVPETREMGPCMRECTEMERRFIYALTICGGKAVDAALAAGYGAKSQTREQREDAARQAAYALMGRERVLNALNEEAKKRLRSGALIAADRLLELIHDPTLSKKDLARVTFELLDRAGLVVQQKVEVTHKTEKEQHVVDEITKLAKGLGLDPTRLLGQRAEMIVDAEFTEVKPRGDPTGLEDIL